MHASELKRLPPRLTVKQAASRLGVSRFTIYRLLRDGSLRPVWVTARTYRVRLSSVEQYEAMLARRNAPSAKRPAPPWKA